MKNIIDIYNTFLMEWNFLAKNSNMASISTEREKSILYNMMLKHKDIDLVYKALDEIKMSYFLQGVDGNNFVLNIYWLFKGNNLKKVASGKYRGNNVNTISLYHKNQAKNKDVQVKKKSFYKRLKEALSVLFDKGKFNKNKLDFTNRGVRYILDNKDKTYIKKMQDNFQLKSNYNREKLNDNVKKLSLTRDNFSCVICNKGQGAFLSTLVSHHIIPVHAGGIDEVDNIITLCDSDHMVLHHIENNNGYLNISESDFNSYTKKEQEIIYNLLKYGMYAYIVKDNNLKTIQERRMPSEGMEYIQYIYDVKTG